MANTRPIVQSSNNANKFQKEKNINIYISIYYIYIIILYIVLDAIYFIGRYWTAYFRVLDAFWPKTQLLDALDALLDIS